MDNYIIPYESTITLQITLMSFLNSFGNPKCINHLNDDTESKGSKSSEGDLSTDDGVRCVNY